jgi:hypothetical protein
MREEWKKPVGNKFYQPLERIDILGRKTFVAATMRLLFVESYKAKGSLKCKICSTLQTCHLQ